MLQPGDIVNGKYKIVGLVGRGGMSAVYRAQDLATGRILAIKDVERSKSSGTEIFEERLTQEGQMLKRLSNPHLPKIYDIIENQNSFMLVMDFVEGESLDKVIARLGAQSEPYVYNWGMQICDVFSYLHGQNPPIIYRDMKPANVILQPDGRIMMIDFGTARTQKMNTDRTSDTVCLGTEGFAAPEQYGGLGESDARTDIFCLGATLYNMITGHSPYDVPKGILPLAQWNPALAGSPLNYIIAKCTRPSPLERYQTAEELRMDLSLAESGLLKTDNFKPMSNQGWQKQFTKTTGALTGLSGLLQRGLKSERKNSRELDENQPAARPTPQPAAQPAPQPAARPAPQPAAQPAPQPAPARRPEWQQASGAAQTPPVYPARTAPAPRPEPARGEEPGTGLLAFLEGGIWWKLMIFSALAAVFLLLLGVIVLAVGGVTFGVILMIFAVAALCLAGVGFYFNRQSDGGADGGRGV